jgi:hypothetical protein
MVVCVSVRGVVRFCYVLIQVCFIKKKILGNSYVGC